LAIRNNNHHHHRRISMSGCLTMCSVLLNNCAILIFSMMMLENPCILFSIATAINIHIHNDDDDDDEPQLSERRFMLQQINCEQWRAVWKCVSMPFEKKAIKS
jgi:hypothetical protein